MRALPTETRAEPRFAVARVTTAGLRARLADAHAAGALATPFQSAAWLAALDAVVAPALAASIELLWVTDAASHDLIVALPIARRRTGGLRVVEIADLGVADYQSPLIGPAAASVASDMTACAALLAAIRRALGDVDLLRLEKMPHEIAGRANPLALLAGARASRFSANRLTIETTVDAFIASRGKKYRKEAERCFRRMAEEGEVRFARAETVAEIEAAYTQLEAWQHARHVEAGHVYALDRPELSRFYRHLALAGTPYGTASTSPSPLGGTSQNIPRSSWPASEPAIQERETPAIALTALDGRGKPGQDEVATKQPEDTQTISPASKADVLSRDGRGCRQSGEGLSSDIDGCLAASPSSALRAPSTVPGEGTLASRFASIFTLSVGGRFVAILYGVEHAGTFTLLRIADAGDAWKHVSPGRLVVIETMRHMVGRGIRVFDMGIGDYPFKRWIGCAAHPLADLEIALTWRALPKVAAGRLKRRLRENERLRALVARLRAVRAPVPAPVEIDDPK